MDCNQDLSHELDAAMTIQNPTDYLKRIEELRQQYDHGITILPDGAGRLRNFNCFAYAFGIWDHSDFITLVEETLKGAIMNSKFVLSELAQGYLTEIAIADVQVGDVVLYFTDEALTHAGKVVATDNRIRVHSKWGPSEAHAHGLYEVPHAYGTITRFFRPPNPDEILDRLYDAT